MHCRAERRVKAVCNPEKAAPRDVTDVRYIDGEPLFQGFFRRFIRIATYAATETIPPAAVRKTAAAMPAG